LAVPESLRHLLHQNRAYKSQHTSYVLRPVSPPRSAQTRLTRFARPHTDPTGRGGRKDSFGAYRFPNHELGAMRGSAKAGT
jgi:hypothetical protein